MKKLLTLSIIALLTACSSSTDPNGSQYPFNNQTWKVQSADLADWIGVQGAANVAYKAAADSLTGDTLYIESPDLQDLKMYESQAVLNKGFVIEFADLDLKPEDSFLISADTLFGNADLQTSRAHLRDSDSAFVREMHYNFDCSVSYTSSDTLWVVLGSGNNDTTRVYAIKVAGALESVDHIVCLN